MQLIVGNFEVGAPFCVQIIFSNFRTAENYMELFFLMKGRLLSDTNISVCQTSSKLIISRKQEVDDFANFNTESIGELHVQNRQVAFGVKVIVKIKGRF